MTLSKFKTNSDGKVIGVECGIINRIGYSSVQYEISARLMDEDESNGRHAIYFSTDSDEPVIVQVGWPFKIWPRYDDMITIEVHPGETRDFPIFANFDPEKEVGPYWIKIEGDSDLLYGIGLPYNRLVSFEVKFLKLTRNQN